MSTGFERIGRDSRLQDHWIRRLVAFIIDSIILAIGTLIIAAIVAMPFIIMAAATGLPWFVFNPFTFPFFAGVLSVLYFALLESYYGWTFGKRIMNLKTIDLGGQKTPSRCSFHQKHKQDLLDFSSYGCGDWFSNTGRSASKSK